jgi:hypothetical protein
MGKSLVPRIVKEVDLDDSTNARKSNQKQETLTEGLAKMDFSKLTRKNQPSWREFCKRRIANTEEQLTVWIWNETKMNQLCNCYGINLDCWGMSGESWTNHTENCEVCREWSRRSCRVQGHSIKSKSNILLDLGNRHQTEEVLTNEQGQTCCELNICIHEFFNHQKFDIPWWACLNEECDEHQDAKGRNKTYPQVPRIIMIRDDKCPCLNKGCVCNFSRRHPFHKSLLNDDECVLKTCGLHRPQKEPSELEKIAARIEELSKEIEMLKTNMKIQKTTTDGIVPQLKTTVKVNRKEIEAIVDCGADVNYANEEWCKKEGFLIKTHGFGNVKSYDGKRKKVPIQTVNIPFRLQGKHQRQTFKVFTDTGDDKMVLGMPWLSEINPDIDWKKRTIKIGKVASTDQGEDAEPSDLQKRQLRNPKETTEKNDKETADKEKEYQKELKSIQEKLPKELTEFADVFCEKK